MRGTVRRLEQFGAFVELAPGLDGLVHVSQLALDRRISHPRQVVTIGDEVDVTVVEVDAEKRRIGLSMVEQARKRARRGRGEPSARRPSGGSTGPTRRGSLGTLGDLLAASRKPK